MDEWRYSSTRSPRHYMEVRGQFHATAALHLGHDTAHMDKRAQKPVVK
jgi:hypothetical protein